MAGLVAATAALASVTVSSEAAITSARSGPLSASPSAAGEPLTEEQVADLTAPGRVYDSSEELQLADRAFLQRWGGIRPEQVADPLQAACDAQPTVCGGLAYDAASLTYTMLLVPGSSAVDLGKQATAAFNKIASGSNLRFRIEDASTSLNTASKLVAEINTPELRSAQLKSLNLPEGSFGAGYVPSDRHVSIYGIDDKTVAALAKLYGSRASVSLPTSGMQPRESRREDSPSNGWNAGMALCLWNGGSASCTPASADPREAGCTLGLAWIRSGGRYSTTAGHCFRGITVDTNLFRMGPTKIAVGSPRTFEFVNENNNGDAALMRNTHLDTQYNYNNKMWIGAAANTAPAERLITGSDDTPSIGQNVTLSGANGGMRYGQVGSTTPVANICGGVGGYPFTSGIRINNLVAEDGHSGGPMTTRNVPSPAEDDYLAMGILSCDLGMTSVAQISALWGGFAANY